MENKEELKELALQLSKPQGTKGIEVANMMNEVNIKMTLHAIDQLSLKDNEHILELGHGNCGHLAHLLNQKKGLTYTGLEMSELMYAEAQGGNKEFIEGGQASFYLYDGLNIPFPDAMFDKIFTVNTLYFWRKPAELLSELYRVLKPNGRLNITFGQKDFMQKLPFVQYGFELYDDKKIQELLNSSAFKLLRLEEQTEALYSKTGEWVNRVFTTAVVEK